MKKFAMMMTVAALVTVGFAACGTTSKTAPKANQPTAKNAPAKVEHATPNMNAEKLEPYECGTVTRLNTLGGVFLASQPNVADIEQAAMGGIELVVNMRHESEMTDFNEKEVAEKNGMRYINLPWNGANELTDKILDEARRILREETRPMMVHCSSANRVGAVWLAYRVLDNGISYEDALAEAKVVGMKTPAYETITKAYIAKRQ